MPTLFPSPHGHPTDMPCLGDFIYCFPAIHVRTSSCATVSTMAKFQPGCLYLFQTYLPVRATIGSPICAGTLHQCTFSSLFVNVQQRTCLSLTCYSMQQLQLSILTILESKIRQEDKIQQKNHTRNTIKQTKLKTDIIGHVMQQQRLFKTFQTAKVYDITFKVIWWRSSLWTFLYFL